MLGSFSTTSVPIYSTILRLFGGLYCNAKYTCANFGRFTKAGQLNQKQTIRTRQKALREERAGGESVLILTVPMRQNLPRLSRPVDGQTIHSNIDPPTNREQCNRPRNSSSSPSLSEYSGPNIDKLSIVYFSLLFYPKGQLSFTRTT